MITAQEAKKIASPIYESNYKRELEGIYNRISIAAREGKMLISITHNLSVAAINRLVFDGFKVVNMLREGPRVLTISWN